MVTSDQVISTIRPKSKGMNAVLVDHDRVGTRKLELTNILQIFMEHDVKDRRNGRLSNGDSYLGIDARLQ